MRDIAEFMQDLFLTRAAEEKSILANRAPYRQKFFDADCRWDNRAFTLKMIESEKILNIESSGSEAAVITEYEIRSNARAVRIQRWRYHLKASGERWVIYNVEHRCIACRGEGDASCMQCKGKHWI